MGLGVLGYNRREFGQLTMRHFINALTGHVDKSNDEWERARMIAWYSAFDRKPFKITEIWIPGDKAKKEAAKVDPEKKEDAYKLLEKWSK